MHINAERAEGAGELTVRAAKGLCGACGAAMSARVIAHLSSEDAEAFGRLAAALAGEGLGALNPTRCEACGAEGRAEAPLTVHLPGERRLIVALPEHDRYRALEALAEQLALLSARESVPARQYFAQAELAVGAEALAAALEGVRPAAGSATQVTPLPAEGARGLGASLTPPGPGRAAPSLSPLSALASPAPASSLDALLDAALDDPTGVFDLGRAAAPAAAPAAALTPKPALASTPALTPKPALAPLKRPTHPAEAPTVILQTTPAPQPPAPAAVMSYSALQEASSGDATRSSDDTDIADIAAAADPASTQLLYSSTMRRFDADLAGEGRTYLKLNGEVIEAAAQLDERQAEGWMSVDLDVRVQLHLVDGGAAPALTLFSSLNGEVEDELCWPIEIDGAVGPKVLRQLRRGFRFELTLFKKNGNIYGQRVVEAPLEENVGYILSTIKRLHMTPKQAAHALFVTRDESFDRVGRMKHTFTRDSFGDIEHAADAQLAVGIWAYWSTVKQRDYLLFVKSFPLPWLRRIQHRVLKAAVDFGIAMPAHLRSQAVALRLAKSDVELLQRTVAHFAEVNLQLKPSQLTPEQLWANWEALLTQMEELGIPADEEIEMLAFEAMQRLGLDFDEPDEPSALSSAAGALESVDLDAVEDSSSEVDLEPVAARGEEAELVADDLIEEELLDDELVSEAMIEEELEEEALIVSEELIEEELIEEELIEEELLEIDDSLPDARLDASADDLSLDDLATAARDRDEGL